MFAYVASVRAEVQYAVDIYKTKQISIDTIKTMYANEFKNIARIIHSAGGPTSTDNSKAFVNSQLKVINGIKKMGKFSHVGLSPIMYSDDKVIYISLDVIDKDDKSRSSILRANPHKKFDDPDNLISTWKEDEKMGFSIFLKKRNLHHINLVPHIIVFLVMIIPS